MNKILKVNQKVKRKGNTEIIMLIKKENLKMKKRKRKKKRIMII